MPRTYIKKTSRGNFKEEQVEAAINAVKEGKSIREAGRTYGIAESTIRLRMKRRCLKLERRIKHEENDYYYYKVQYILQCKTCCKIKSHLGL